MSLFRNNGGGTFSEHMIAEDMVSTSTIIASDVNGDGYLEIAVSEYNAAAGGMSYWRILG